MNKASDVSHIDRHIGRRMREARLAAGCSLDAVASEVGVTAPLIRYYERGSRRCYAARLYRIAKFLGVDVSYFYEGVEPARRAPRRQMERPGEGGLCCPRCRSNQVIVTDSRAHRVAAKRRRRACKVCGKRWWTLEMAEDDYFEALASAGRLNAIIQKKRPAQGVGNG